MGANLTVPVVDLTGKVAIVTGGNSGIGYEIVRGLAEMGATTIMASRSEERATAAVAKLKESSEKDLKIEFMRLDLASFQSVKDFVRAFKEKNLPLHILVNNAAVAGIPFTKTDDGYEMHYQVNHLSPMLLTLELLPLMIETAATTGDGRILYVSSGAHKRMFGARFNPENLNSEIGYERLKVYANTKLYNVLTMYALQRRLQGVGLTVSAQEPGYVRTELARGFADKKFLSFINTISYATIARTPREGAATTLCCAVDPALNSQTGLYYASCKEATSDPDARNEEFQEELWRRSFFNLKDHLSPEVYDKYKPTDSSQSDPSNAGPNEENSQPQQETSPADAEPSEGGVVSIEVAVETQEQTEENIKPAEGKETTEQSN